jgi:hypothetical protein
MVINPNEEDSMEATTVAQQINTLLSNLREDVAVAKQRHTDAALALRDALAQFRPQPIGRPPGAAKKTRTRKAKAEPVKVEEVAQ